MDQLTIYDFLEENVHDDILDRLSNIFNAEVLGYVKTWEWEARRNQKS